jgi:dolichol-phosphate mannosyltransferase
MLSIVIPVYNEAAVIPELRLRLDGLFDKLAFECEAVLVDDGSTDGTLELLRAVADEDSRYRVIALSRNFGQQAAVTAGLDHAVGEAVVVMDADLQDPPEVVFEMVRVYRQGYDVVYGRRARRDRDGLFKRATAALFYRFFRFLVPIHVPLDAGDFRLMSRRVVVAFRELREAHRFVRAMVAWLGFRQAEVVYDRPGRFAGETKYSLGRMIAFTVDGITSFSILPLRLSTCLGLAAGAASVLAAVWATVSHFLLGTVVRGSTTMIIVSTLLASVQLVMIGVLGEYVGRIYEQVKGRPLYIVAEDSGADRRNRRLRSSADPEKRERVA